jgi:hypothetical protein
MKALAAIVLVTALFVAPHAHAEDARVDPCPPVATVAHGWTDADGTVHARTPNKLLLVSGAITMGVGAVGAATIAALFALSPFSKVEPEEAAVELVPFVGPFTAFLYQRHSGGVALVSLAAGVLQIGGALMVGLAFLPHYTVVQSKSASLTIAPLPVNGGQGIALGGSF